MPPPAVLQSLPLVHPPLCKKSAGRVRSLIGCDMHMYMYTFSNYMHIYYAFTHLHLTCIMLTYSIGTLSLYLTCGLSTTGPVLVIGSPFLVQYSVVAVRAANGKIS